MAAKVLNMMSCERFYKLRDALADFAYEKLDIEGDLYYGTGKKYSNHNVYNENTLAETLDEVWRSPSILDTFIKRNPASLNAKDLAAVKSWRNSLSGLFILFKYKNKLLFMRGSALFEVTGLWEEIETVLRKSEFPMVIETTLLPFEGKIVYHGVINFMPVSIGKGMRDMLESEIDRAVSDPEIISSSDEFVRIVPEIKAKEAEELEKKIKREAALAEEGKRQMEGFHKGKLSGLNEQEREEAINAEIKRTVSEGLQQTLVERLKRSAIKGSVTRDFDKLLLKESKDFLQRWAIALGTKVKSRGTKSDLVSTLISDFRTKPFAVELILHRGLNTKQLDACRNLYEKGGVLEIQEEEIKTLSGLPPVVSPICYSFYTKGTSKKCGKFTFVIPNDIMKILSGVDWDGIRGQTSNCEAAADIAEAVTELRGVAKVSDAYKEFCRFYPDTMGDMEFGDSVANSIEEESIGCVWLEADDGEDYLLHYEMADYYLELAGQDNESYEDEFGDDGFIEGPAEFLEFIEEPRKTKKLRHLEADMLSSEAVFNWKLKRPAVRALRSYLDEHVPNSQNDYFYADSVLEDLIDYMAFGTMNGSGSINDWLSILEDHDYLPNEAHLKRVIDLLMNMYNSLPTWMNNGWAPNELADMKFGRKSFYNEDGSRMKVGRNDPCPCGSGKKYKNCCGKRT